uniref:Ankyrin repeat and SOCS box containing 2a, tandem duplicate 2 n=1 Tax=Fundulus heteroclitus TaxID=8078 RepID=A0A3Q2T878_FUNHE
MADINLEDYSVYDHLTDEELLQIAVERSLCDMHPLPASGQRSASLSTSADPPPEPRPRNLDPPQLPPSQPPQPVHVHNYEHPPQFLYKPVNTGKHRKKKINTGKHFINSGNTGKLQTRAINPTRQLINTDSTREKPRKTQINTSQHWETVINRCTLKNETALLLAASQGNASCVDFLLRHGANVNTANKAQETPLFTACEHPNEEVVELLLRYGAQVNLACSQGESPLHEACRHGCLRLCRMLLDAGASMKAKNIYNIQPLFRAAQNGHGESLQLLIERGADVNGQAGDGASPLYEACKNGHVSAVQALLALKADVNRATNAGLLPLHVAVKNNHKRIVSLLIPLTSRVRIQNCGISPLHIAAETNRGQILELLIESGFNVNAELSDERAKMYEDRRSTALYFCVSNGNLQAAEMLLEAGANPNLDVFNPLLIAVRLGWMDMAELLVRYGADVNARMFTQPSAFPSTILLGMESPPILKLLLDNGCDPSLCFQCSYGLKPHPRRPSSNIRDVLCVFQYCEVISSSHLCQISGPIISMLLDYVGHVSLCSRLLEILDSRSDWASIKLKAVPPHPLMQLCRLKIRCLLGVQRLKLIHTLPLPVRLIRFLCYDLKCPLT